MANRMRLFSVACASAAILGMGSLVNAGWPFSRHHEPACTQPAACAQPLPVNCAQPAGYDEDDGDSKRKRICQCLHPGEPPRGETVIAFPARISREFARESERDRESARESAPTGAIDQRVEVLEKDLTRLTLIVEKLVDAQKRDSADLTRLTLAVEEVAIAQKQGQQDLTRMSLILDKLAK